MRALRAWIAWWAASAALWLALVDRLEPAELATGAVVAALASCGAAAVRRERPTGVRIRAVWGLRALRASAGLVTGLPLLAAVLWRRGVLRRPEHGAVRRRRFAATDAEDPVQAGDRAAVQAVGTIAPATVVLDVDVEAGVLVVHELRAR